MAGRNLSPAPQPSDPCLGCGVTPLHLAQQGGLHFWASPMRVLRVGLSTLPPGLRGADADRAWVAAVSPSPTLVGPAAKNHTV